MKKLIFGILLFSSLTTFSQTQINKDAAIEQMVKQISIDTLQNYLKKLVSFGTRNTLSPQTKSNRGIAAARNWVLQKFVEFGTTANGRLTSFIDTTTLLADGKRIDRKVVLGNVVATLKGTDPNDNRVFIISGHLDNMRTSPTDSIGDAPGANDDGSGTVAVMECARIMSKQSFSATIIFVAVSGEEQGLLGANYMSEKAKKENWNIEAVLNNDIMGSNNSNETNIIDNTKVRVFSEGLPAFETEKNATNIRNLGLENDGKARQLARYVKEIGERYVDNLQVVLVYRNDRFLRGGDHTPYVQRGFAAVRLTEMNENYTRQHQNVRTENGIEYGDLEQYIDYNYLKKNVGINLATLANLAKAPSMPDSVKIDVKKLSNQTTLSWKPSKTGNPKGYYVLIRETTNAFWQKKIFTTATEIILPYSKDNYFFAVQAVNNDGNESLPLVPLINR
jgi:Peptidase family M28